MKNPSVVRRIDCGRNGVVSSDRTSTRSIKTVLEDAFNEKKDSKQIIIFDSFGMYDIDLCSDSVIFSAGFRNAVRECDRR